MLPLLVVSPPSTFLPSFPLPITMFSTPLRGGSYMIQDIYSFSFEREARV